MTDEKDTAQSPAATLDVERTDNFVSFYANNAYFEASAWDLKIVFGQLDQPTGKTPVVRQHVAVTIPWSQAKLALYWLRLQVEATEIQQGTKIPIRKDLIPPEPPPLSEEDQKNPDTIKMHKFFQKLHAEFVATL